MLKYAIGIDIGGTKIAAGLVSLKGKVLRKEKLPTSKNVSENIRNIIFLIDRIRKGKVYPVGIGIAGQIDIKKGRVIYSPNLPAWQNVTILKKIKKNLEAKFATPYQRIKIDNDANCFTFAEWKLCYPKVKNLIGITLGTGIGSGAIVDGKLYHGEAFAPEIGHTVIEIGGRRCACKKLGHFEAYSSGRAIEKQYFSLTGQKLQATEIEKRVFLGDLNAKAVYRKAKEYLAVGLANVICNFDPEIIVLGGTIGVKSKLLYLGLENLIKKNLFLKGKKIRVVKTKLGEEGGLIGAAVLAMKF